MFATLLLPVLLLASGPPRPAEILLLDSGGARLVFVDAATFEPRGEVKLAGRPQDMAVSPTGGRVLVSDSYDPATRQAGSRVFVADLVAKALLKTIDLGYPCQPLGLAWAPDEAEAWVTCRGRLSVLAIDPAAGKVVAEVAVKDPGASLLAMAPDGSRLWVASQLGNRLIEIEPRTRQVIRRFAIGRNPTDLALAPDGRSLWVTSYNEQEIDVVDLLRTPAGPVRMLFNPSTHTACVLGNSAGTIALYDPERRLEVERRAVGTGPMTAAFAPDGSVVAVGLTGKSPGVVLLDPVTLERRAGAALPFAPWGVAWLDSSRPARTGGGVSPSPQSSK